MPGKTTHQNAHQRTPRPALRRTLFAVLVLGLVATSCTTTSATIASEQASAPPTTPTAPTSSDSADTVDPDWHLTQEELEAGGQGNASSNGSEPASSSLVPVSAGTIDEQPNDGAPFDRFVMDLFPDAQPEQFAAFQKVIAGYCSGLVDENSIGQLTTIAAHQDRILGISDEECDTLESGPLITTATVDAATWDEAVERRFARTVWWYDRDAFADRAVAACQAGSSSFDLGLDLDLSVSVVAELAAFTTHGDCTLLTVEDGAAVQTGTAADLGITDSPSSTNTTLYFTRSGGEEEYADRTRDLYSLDIATDTVTRFTTGKDIREAALSPAGTQLAYLARDPELLEGSQVHVIDLASGEGRQVGTIDHIGDLAWTADGSALVHSIADDDRRLIGLLDVATGAVSVAVDPALERAWQQDLVGNDLIYQDTDGRTHFLIRQDLASGDVVDSVSVPYGRVDISEDGSLVAVVERQTGEISLIDMEVDAMALQPIPSGPGLEAGLRISPNNQYIAYGVGPEFAASDVYISDLESPETRVNLTADVETTKVGFLAWSTDSRTVFFVDNNADGSSMYAAAIDGTVTDLGQSGRILFAAAN